jgi:hypothetical protein
MALWIDSFTGVTLASWGNSTSSKFQGLEVLFLWDSLRSSTHEVSTRVTQANLEKLCFHGIPKKEVLSIQDTLRCSTPTSTIEDVIAKSTPYTRFPTDAPTRAFFFLVHEWRGFARDPSQNIQTPKWISTRRSTSKGGTRMDYLLHFFGSPTRVPQASLQSDSALTHRQDQKPQNPRRTSWPQEEGRWVISPNSRASHPFHSLHLGTTADQSMTLLGTDFKKHAIWQGSIEKPAAKDLVARKDRTIDWNEV